MFYYVCVSTYLTSKTTCAPGPGYGLAAHARPCAFDRIDQRKHMHTHLRVTWCIDTTSTNMSAGTHTNTQVKGENARAPHCGRAQYGVFFVMHEQRQRCCYTVSCMCVCVCILAQSHRTGIRHITLTSPPLRFLLFSMRIIIVWSIHSLAQSPTVCLVVCVPSCYICFAFLVGGFGAHNVQHNASEYVGRIMRSMGGG